MSKDRNDYVMLLDEESVETTVLLGDRSTISSTRTLRDTGEMFAQVTIARTGIMLYKAKELGKVAEHLPPEKICRVRTKPEVLFDQATIDGCRSLPITINHPKDDVDINNNKELQKGFLEGVPTPDGSHLAGTLVLNDKQAIALVDAGVDQVSLGHKALLVPCDDEEADFDKVKIIPNHVAIVRRGRAQTTRIGDDGSEIDIVDKATFDVVEAQRDDALAALEVMKQRLADAESVRMSDEAIQAEVETRTQKRVELLTNIAKLGDEYTSLDFSGKSDKEIKVMVVNKLHDKDFSDKSEDYLDARLDTAFEGNSGVSLTDALSVSLAQDKQKQSEAPKKSPRQAALERRAARNKI